MIVLAVGPTRSRGPGRPPFPSCPGPAWQDLGNETPAVP